MADLGGELVERGAKQGECVQDGGVAVALDDLGADGVGGEAEAEQSAVFISGGTLAWVPTAPDILPVATSSWAAWSRLRWRPISSYHMRSLRPNVVGSAWIPCERPIMIVCLCSSASAARVTRRVSTASSMTS